MILDDHVDNDPKISYFFLGANSNIVAPKGPPDEVFGAKSSAEALGRTLKSNILINHS